MDDRAPPCALDAERSCLGAVLIAPRLFADLAAAVDGGDFMLPAHREIYDAMVSIHGRRQPVDLVALGDELKTRGLLARLDGGEGYLTTLAMACPTVENLAHYCRIVKEKAILRAVISVAGELASRAYGDPGDFDGFLSDAQRQMTRLVVGGVGPQAVHVSSGLRDTVAAIAERAEGKSANCYPSGFPALDGKLTLKPESFVVVAARPGIGKSAFVLNLIMRGAMQGYPALLLSLEMSEEEIHERMLAFETGISVNTLSTTPPNFGMAEFERVKKASTKLSRLPIHIRTKTMRLGAIQAEARSWRARNPTKLGIVVVDYVQLVEPDRVERGQTEYAIITATSKALKRLAQDLSCIVIGVCALGRGADKEERRPRADDLKGSGSLEQDADRILLLYRQLRGMPIEKKGRMLAEDECEARVVKNRRGPLGMVILNWHGETNRFDSFDPAEADLRRH